MEELVRRNSSLHFYDLGCPEEIKTFGLALEQMAATVVIPERCAQEGSIVTRWAKGHMSKWRSDSGVTAAASSGSLWIFPFV